MDGLEDFLNITNGYRDVAGYGYRPEDEDEYGYGSGYGYGDRSGDGNGSGDVAGTGSGYGDGTGYGYGYRYGYGHGHGGIAFINKQKIYVIDGVNTVITHVKGNVAKGFIFNRDLTKTPCYIVKRENLFAHGKTLREAVKSVENKYIASLNVDEKIKKFKEVFNCKKKYPASEFSCWHGILTGSCELGRKSFLRNNAIKDNDMFTVSEFVEKCKNSYGSDVIVKLKESE